MKNKNQILKIAVILLILIEIGLSVWLIQKQGQEADVCIVGHSCQQVQATKYGSLFGIKLSVIGLTSFIILGISFFINRKLFLILSSIGALFSIYLVVIQLLILNQTCSSCIVIDSLMILIAGLGFFISKEKSKL
jgi:uncharacterized membrane protein